MDPCCHGNSPRHPTSLAAGLTWEGDCCRSSMALDVWKEPLHGQAVAPGRLEDRDQAASRVVHSLPCVIHCGPQNAKMKWPPFAEHLPYATVLAVLAKACHVLPDSCHHSAWWAGRDDFPRILYPGKLLRLDLDRPTGIWPRSWHPSPPTCGLHSLMGPLEVASLQAL